jgi:DNA-binding protein HU-beta
MNKTDLVNFVAEKVDVSKALAARALDAMLEGVHEGITKDGSVALVGHGTYSVSERAEREGRNPQTGEKMIIKASKSVKFKVGKDLKDKVNDK